MNDFKRNLRNIINTRLSGFDEKNVSGALYRVGVGISTDLKEEYGYLTKDQLTVWIDETFKLSYYIAVRSYNFKRIDSIFNKEISSDIEFSSPIDPDHIDYFKERVLYNINQLLDGISFRNEIHLIEVLIWLDLAVQTKLAQLMPLYSNPTKEIITIESVIANSTFKDEKLLRVLKKLNMIVTFEDIAGKNYEIENSLAKLYYHIIVDEESYNEFKYRYNKN